MYISIATLITFGAFVMDAFTGWGAFAFGLVVGWITYRTLRRTETKGISDIAAVIGAVGGGLVTQLFPEGEQAFGAYGIGLAVGFFVYLIVSVIVAKSTGTLDAVNEWLGEPTTHARVHVTGDGSPPRLQDAPPPLPD